MSNKTKIPKPVVLIILDGWGQAPPSKGNAITLAKTPIVSSLIKKYPSTQLCAHGKYVGLPNGQPGNSEAGHTNIGAGRIVKDDALYVSQAINDGTFFKNIAILSAINHVKKNKSQLHLMGLLSSVANAHADPKHLYALLDLAKRYAVQKIYLHLFTDGRDSPQHAAIEALRKLKTHFKNNEKIASISGRFYAMDRKKKWSRLEQAYNLLALGEGLKIKEAEEAVLQAYNRGETDEFIPPTVITRDKKPVATVDDGDGLIFFNLRSDRARQFTKVFVQEEFNKKNPGSFRRKKVIKNLSFIALTDFGPDLDNLLTAFPSRDVSQSLPMVLGRDIRQLYMAEREKYAHITYFFNGGYADPVAGEARISISSPDVDSYDKTPEMSARQITQIVIEQIKNREFQFIALNFANLDMVGHTGNLKAAIQAVECVDKCVKEVFGAAQKVEMVAVITADHGNAEEMLNLETGEIRTSHTTNPVPFILAGEQKKIKLRKNGILGDVAPTILEIMGIKKPGEMTGHSLIKTLKH